MRVIFLDSGFQKRKNMVCHDSFFSGAIELKLERKMYLLLVSL